MNISSTKPLKPLLDNPLISDWLDFSTPGVVRARSGRVELGQGVEIALRRIVAQALSVQLGKVELVAGDTRECPDENYTAGSMSIEIGGMALRRACLAARAVLLGAAETGAELHDGNLVMNGNPTGDDLWSLSSGVNLTAKIADIPVLGLPVEDKSLTAETRQAAADHIRARLIGGAFIHDLELEGMVHARVLHLPHPRGRLKSIDATALVGLPGFITLHRDGNFAAVICEEEAQAMSTVAQADLMSLWDIPTDGAQSADDMLAMADPAEVMTDTIVGASGNTKVSVEIERPTLAHASVGVCCALARWDTRLTVWTHAQGSHPLRAGLSNALGIAPEEIDVIHLPGAGCYGHNGADDVAFEAALLARALPGRPVRLAWRRVDELTRGSLAPPMKTRASITLNENGGVQQVELNIISGPHQRRPGPGKPNFTAGPLLDKPVPLSPATEPPAANGGGADRNATPLYRCEGLKITRRIATDIPIRTSAMRALGAYTNIAAIELAMDCAADAIGQDPVDFKLRHLDDPRARAVIEKVCDMAGFTTKAGDTSAMGLGFSRYKNKAGYCAVCVELEVGEDIRVPRLWAAADVGEAVDPDGVIAQVEGGAIQSLSWTLREESLIERGAPVSRDWEHYPIFRFSDIPEIDVHLAKGGAQPPVGGGEIAQGPTAAAVVTALRRVFGLTALSLPLSFENLSRQLLA